ncbi:hypothetical protein [Bradyrhizobium sp. STM 3557]|uniref:hypothetical protein n=1 Tax=Bradyrhizobium sp. STM 3557 TaxID=578920 RepID=UPI0038910C59
MWIVKLHIFMISSRPARISRQRSRELIELHDHLGLARTLEQLRPVQSRPQPLGRVARLTRRSQQPLSERLGLPEAAA